jgi:hypothetical protein
MRALMHVQERADAMTGAVTIIETGLPERRSETLESEWVENQASRNEKGIKYQPGQHV